MPVPGRTAQGRRPSQRGPEPRDQHERRAFPSLPLPAPFSPHSLTAPRNAQITRFQAHIDSRGQRSSTSAAYLPSSVYTRPNLCILTRTTVERLVLSTDGEKCVGVVLAQDKDPKKGRFVARASRDVILSLGSFGTPQLLQCSGIGSRATLEKAGVECKVENDGVGEGLKDHVLAGVFFETTKGSSWEWVKDPVKTVRCASPLLHLDFSRSRRKA